MAVGHKDCKVFCYLLIKANRLLLIALVRVYVVREKCKKKTENEDTIGFFVPFLSLVEFQLKGGRAPLGYAHVRNCPLFGQ